MVRLARISFATLILALLISPFVSAYVDCNDITESPWDECEMVDFKGRPGDTVWLPVRVKTDSTLSGFLILFKYDDRYLERVGNPLDQQYCVWQLEGRLKDAQDAAQGAGANLFFAQLSQNPADSGALLAAFNLGFTPGDTSRPLAVMPPGDDIAFRIAFKVKETMPHNATASFTFWDVNEAYLDTLSQWVYTDCRRTNYGLQFWKNDTLTNTVISFPTTIPGVFVADTAPKPIVHSFSVQPSSVQTGSTFLMKYTADRTDTVLITGTGVNEVITGSDIGDDVIATASTTAGSYEYRLIACNDYGRDTATATLTVTGGGGGDEHAPVITVSTGYYYETDIGVPVNFTVTATDPDGDVITLSAQAGTLPTGATFASKQGASPISSAFSFTPAQNQTGTHVVRFVAQDASLTTNQSVTIVVLEPEFDKLFSTSVEGDAVGGIPGKDGIMFPIDLVTSQSVYGVQFDMEYDAEAFEVVDIHTTVNTAEYVVYENIGQTPGVVRITTFGMANEPVGNDGTTILNVEMEIDRYATPGLYPVYFTDAWESTNPDPTYPSAPLVTDSGIVQVDALGDVNLDTRVNVADLVSIVGYIIGDYTLSPRRFDVADVITDGAVDVYDLVGVINIIYGLPLNTAPGLTVEPYVAQVTLDYEEDFGGGMMVVRSEIPMDVAAAQLEVLYDPNSMTLGAPRLTAEVGDLTLLSRDNGQGRLRILIYSANPSQVGETIAAGSPNLVEIPVLSGSPAQIETCPAIRLSQALLATPQATAVKVDNVAPLPSSFTLNQNYPNPFNPATTIGFSFGSQDSGAGQRVRLDVYNVLGQSVRTLLDTYLPPGSHEVEWDGTGQDGAPVSSGMYLYRLQVGSDSQTKKMLLLK